MKFTVSTFVTLVAAAAAAPSAREAATAVSQSNQKKLAEYETECPTVNINCCVPVNTENANPMGGGDQTYAAGLVGGLLDGLTELVSNAAGGEKPLPGKQYCSPSTSGSTLTKDLLAALGGYNVKPDSKHSDQCRASEIQLIT